MLTGGFFLTADLGGIMTQENSAQPHFKKWLSISLVTICIAISWIGVIDSKTEDYVDDAIIQSTVAYGSARALNAAISVAQSTQVGVSFVGEASFQPLEILDPVNDMVEDYATVMKYAIGSLITQKLIVEMLATNALKWTLLGIGVLLIIGIFFNGKQFPLSSGASFLSP